MENYHPSAEEIQNEWQQDTVMFYQSSFLLPELSQRTFIKAYNMYSKK
jgi:hypothetical protein